MRTAITTDAGSDLRSILQNRFGLNDFRPGQREAVVIAGGVAQGGLRRGQLIGHSRVLVGPEARDYPRCRGRAPAGGTPENKGSKSFTAAHPEGF